jgi:hypothetical protein
MTNLHIERRDDSVLTLEQAPHVTTAEALRDHGYRPLKIAWLPTTYQHPTLGLCRNFDVVGDVPALGGLYLYNTYDGSADDPVLRVRYIGRTSHLWMTTKGVLPGGGGRGGQRYGRPRHAGATRQRINAAVTADAAEGLQVGLWVRPVPACELHAAEEADILKWDLRRHGLNRG